MCRRVLLRWYVCSLFSMDSCCSAIRCPTSDAVRQKKTIDTHIYAKSFPLSDLRTLFAEKFLDCHLPPVVWCCDVCFTCRFRLSDFCRTFLANIFLVCFCRTVQFNNILKLINIAFILLCAKKTKCIHLGGPVV